MRLKILRWSQRDANSRSHLSMEENTTIDIYFRKSFSMIQANAVENMFPFQSLESCMSDYVPLDRFI